MMKIKETADKYGLRLHVSDAHWKHLSACGNCCAMPCNWNWHKGQFTYAMVYAKEHGKVRWSDIAGYMDFYKKFKWGDATGYNILNQHKKAKFAGATMYDYLHYLWNNPNEANSPYKYFDKVLYPVDIDENGDIIYQFNPDQKDLPSKLRKK